MVNKLWTEREVVMATPIGAIKMTAREEGLASIDWTKECISATEDPLLLCAVKALEDYFKGEKRTFDLPLILTGSAFERAVYGAAIKIPYGETCHYEDIARAIGRPKAARAVGNALKKIAI